MSMFEKATRYKLRFSSGRGQCTVEDLWDLPLTELDKIYKNLNTQAKTFNEDSLLGPKTSESEVVTLGIDVVKHVVSVRLQEKEAVKLQKERADKKHKILAILEEKQESSLKSKSEEELVKMLEEL